LVKLPTCSAREINEMKKNSKPGPQKHEENVIALKLKVKDLEGEVQNLKQVRKEC